MIEVLGNLKPGDAVLRRATDEIRESMHHTEEVGLREPGNGITSAKLHLSPPDFPRPMGFCKYILGGLNDPAA